MLVQLALLLALIIPYMFYLRTLQTTLEKVRSSNRAMSPANVWLLMIPLFSIIYQFIVVGKVSDSLRAEFADRQITLEENRPAYKLGLVVCILVCATAQPFLKPLFCVAAIICFIIYWVKIVQYKRMIAFDAFDSI